MQTHLQVCTCAGGWCGGKWHKVIKLAVAEGVKRGALLS